MGASRRRTSSTSIRLVDAFVKNAGLGFAIPYLHNGQMHDYMPDFLVRLDASARYLILETKDSIRSTT